MLAEHRGQAPGNRVAPWRADLRTVPRQPAQGTGVSLRAGLCPEGWVSGVRPSCSRSGCRSAGGGDTLRSRSPAGLRVGCPGRRPPPQPPPWAPAAPSRGRGDTAPAVPELPPSPAGPSPRVDGCTGGGDRARGCRDAAPQVPPPRGDSGAKHGHRLGSWTGQVPLSPDTPAERQQNPWVTAGRMGTAARSSSCSLTGCRWVGRAASPSQPMV